MIADRQMIAMPPPGTVPFVIDPHVPLTRLDPDTGNTIEVLCVRVDGALHIHPERLEMVRRALGAVLPELLSERDRLLARMSTR